ncbi:hypothetical protein NEUTE1DRAFT_118495 [Neurospora tetrasperma FGSC 2508]|uniref:Uncharacterized protein n=1 Tax=Neurospora tetrasperma (strain FGSC 2508 / ATCC MYA-4615 / P0657) TaxID=510951 RepID=F8N2V3_NEUT8|nr:uncharacterized protein NEUTE1DRAFT_118495 [Neurospora tetrasperma FGSC 2508]EGO51667.1 hypothetical protein NEUTE1DRAFT_118495 [Neurospora tetrasperma FGSC 2508]
MDANLTVVLPDDAACISLAALTNSGDPTHHLRYLPTASPADGGNETPLNQPIFDCFAPWIPWQGSRCWRFIDVCLSPP